MLTKDEVSLYLDEAADELERRGRVVGRLYSKGYAEDIEDCRVCLLGALGAAYFGHPGEGYAMEYLNVEDDGTVHTTTDRHSAETLLEFQQLVATAAKHLPWKSTVIDSALVRFNDTHANSTEEVVELLRTAAEKVGA